LNRFVTVIGMDSLSVLFPNFAMKPLRRALADCLKRAVVYSACEIHAMRVQVPTPPPLRGSLKMTD
jgi:hypothetical protein